MSLATASLASAELRKSRSSVKRDVRSGRLRLADVLLDPPSAICGMRVFEVMALHPHLGRDGCRGALRRLNFAAATAGVNLMSDLGDTTPRQREWLVGRLSTLRVHANGGRCRQVPS